MSDQRDDALRASTEAAVTDVWLGDQPVLVTEILADEPAGPHGCYIPVADAPAATLAGANALTWTAADAEAARGRSGR